MHIVASNLANLWAECDRLVRLTMWRWRLGKLGEGSTVYDQVCIIGARQVFIGKDSRIWHRTFIAVGEGKVVIGDHSHLGVMTYLNASQGEIIIGNHVAIGPMTQIYSYSNSLEPGKYVDECHQVADVHIKDNVLIGSSATLLPGVTIHAGAAVGAGAVVTRDVPANVIVAGVPASPVGQRPG